MPRVRTLAGGRLSWSRSIRSLRLGQTELGDYENGGGRERKS